MPHIHDIYDSDKRFIIDGISRVIKNASTSKTTVMQYDHNSEVFTFEVPRYIEGHDMMQCNRVEVHYLNIDTKTQEEHEGIYLVDDLQISPDDETKLICSWVISQNATGLVGSLNFLLRFICFTDDVIDYVWNTAIHSGIYVSKGIYNSDIVAEQYIDTIKAWENRLKVVENSIGSSGISPTIKVTAIAGGNKVEITDVNGTKIFNIMHGTNGADGKDGSNGKDGYTPVKGIDYFDGTNGNDGADGANGISPTLSVAKITGGHRVTITDINGTNNFDVMDGIDGKDGQDGKNGADGSCVSEDRVLELINEQLGVIENGTY